MLRHSVYMMMHKINVSKSALSFQLTTHQELWAFIVTNLASVYIREGNRHQEVRGLMSVLLT